MKILAVASGGGHWVQLLRLSSVFESCDLVFVSTYKSYTFQDKPHKFYSVTDANRWNKLGLLKMANEIRVIVNKEKPDYIVSTGAAPGLAAIFWGRLIGSKTIWIDSIANVDQISLSGRLIKPFTNLHLTQWPHLAKGKTQYKGTVIT